MSWIRPAVCVALLAAAGAGNEPNDPSSRPSGDKPPLLTPRWTATVGAGEHEWVMEVAGHEDAVFALVCRADADYERIGLSDSLLRLRASDGKILWRYDAPPSSRLTTFVKLRGWLVAAGATGLFWIDCRTGSLGKRLTRNWATPGLGRPYDPHFPKDLLLQEGRLVVRLAQGDLLCVDGKTGKELWYAPLDVPDIMQLKACGDKMLVGAREEDLGVFAVRSETGKLVGGLDSRLPELRRGGEPVTGRLMLASLIRTTQMAAVSFDAGAVWNAKRGWARVSGGIDLLTGTTKWDVEVSGLVMELWAVGNRVFASLYSGEIMCLDARNGAILWRRKPPQRKGDNPRSLLTVVRMTERMLYVLGLRGDMLCIDGESGETVWHVRVDVGIEVDTNTAVAGGDLIVVEGLKIHALPVFRGTKAETQATAGR